MLDALRQSQAIRLARRAAESRRAVTPDPRVRERRVVVVMPRALEMTSDEQREAWTFLSMLDLAPSHIVPLVFGRDVGTPDAFAGAVLHVTDGDLDWRRMPKRVVAEAVWTRRPDVPAQATLARRWTRRRSLTRATQPSLRAPRL